MLDFTRYFDKKPTVSYAVGPSGLGVVQTGFGVLWRGWHVEGRGIFVEKSDDYSPSTSIGQYVSGSDEVLTTENLSVAWDSLSRVWAGTQVGSTTTLYAFSGTAHSDYAFAGVYPQIFYNTCTVSGEYSKVQCFYLKIGQNKIFIRTEDDAFANESIFHEDFSDTPARLIQVIMCDTNGRQMDVFGQYENGLYFKLSSSLYIGATDFYSNFDLVPTGVVSGFVNANLSAGRFIYRELFWFPDIQARMSGDANPSQGQCIVDKSMLMAYDDMHVYSTGIIPELTGGVRMYQGITWQ